MSGEQIQVREGWWRQRCGDIVRVTLAQCGHFKWESTFEVFLDNGRTDTECVDDADLMEFLGEEIEVRRVR